MQKIRLTDIGLRLDGREFAIGDELVVGEDLSHELAHSRLTANTAELVLIGEALSPEFQVALNDLVGLFNRLQTVAATACHLALAAAGPTEAVALLAALSALDPMHDFDAFAAVSDRVREHERTERDRIQSQSEAGQLPASDASAIAEAEIDPALTKAGSDGGQTGSAGEASLPADPPPSEAAPAATTSPITPATSGASGAAAGAKAPAAKPKKPTKPKAPAILPGAAKGAS